MTASPRARAAGPAARPTDAGGLHDRPWLVGLLRLATAVLVVAASVLSAVGAVEGDRVRTVLPVAVALAAGLGVLALTRFSAFVLLALGLRSSLDLFKLSGRGAGDALSAEGRFLDPASILSVLFLLAAAAWLLARIADGRALRGSGLRTALLVLAAAAAVSVLGSDRPDAGAVEVLRILSIVMMFVVLEQLVTGRTTLVRTLLAAYAGMVVPLLYTLAGFVAGSPATEVKGSFTRITGPFDQSNTFARFLAFMIVFGVALYPVLDRRLKVAMAATLALSSTFLVLTLTRGAVTAAVVGVVVVAVAQRRTRTLLALAVAAAVAFVAVPDLGARFSSLGAPDGVAVSGSDDGLEWRLRYWGEVVPLAADSPVTGIGLGTTELRTDAEKKPHSDFVRAYVETGLLGLGAYLAVHVLLLRTAWVALRRSAAGTLEHAVGAGALGTAVCFTLGSAAANIVSNVVSMWYFVAFAACAAAVARDRRG